VENSWAGCKTVNNKIIQNQQAKFNQTWYKSSLGKGNSKWPGLLQRGDNHKMQNEVGSFKIKELIFTWKLFWCNVDSSVFKSWPLWIGRGQNRENMYVFILKKIFSRSSRPISLKLSTNDPSVKTIIKCLNEGPDSCPRGDDHKMQKCGRSLKTFLLRTS
jgi:hypothetical protein